MAEKAGVSAVCVHGRTRAQFYQGKADWDIIRAVKESVGIPVLGNGDIFHAEDALRMKEETGCDGVMIARGAEGNPWIFRDVKALLHGKAISPVSVQERFDKTTGNVAYHAYQSFKTGEVSPQLAHQLGVELARKMWGDQYQVLVATHFNTGTYHNHLVVNAVNIWNGKKFNCNEGAYWKLRSLSDALCREHGLTVIETPKGKPHASFILPRKTANRHGIT